MGGGLIVYCIVYVFRLSIFVVLQIDIGQELQARSYIWTERTKDTTKKPSPTLDGQGLLLMGMG